MIKMALRKFWLVSLVIFFVSSPVATADHASQNSATPIMADLPPAPELLIPPDGGIVAFGRLKLAWESMTQVDSYKVEIDNNADFSSPERIKILAASEWIILPLLPPSVWYWHVQSYNSEGWGDWPEIRRFEKFDYVPLDTLIIDSVQINYGSNLASVQVHAVTFDSVVFYNLPVKWNAPWGSTAVFGQFPQYCW